MQNPISLGLNNNYTAVASVATNSSSRVVTRVTIREVTASDSKPSYNLPTIPEVPQIQLLTPSYDPQQAKIPIIPPPPNFHPTQYWLAPSKEDAQLRQQQLRVSPLSQGKPMRISATTIRTSTASTDDGKARSENDFNLSQPYSVSSNNSPSYRGSISNADSKPLLSNSAWLLTDGSRKGLLTAPSISATHTLHCQGSRKGSLPLGYNTSFLESARSRFSWHVTPTDRARNWFTRWFVEWWLLEIISWLFSAICMIIIVIVLGRYDGKELLTWKLGISINAFMSIFSGFAKSSLLLPTAEALGQLKWNWFRKGEKSMMDFEVIDSASRGPWGSAVLIAQSKGVSLASFGAMIILSSLLLDLFFQQIISFPSAALLDRASNATISRAILYDPNPEMYWQNGSSRLPPDLELDSYLSSFWQGNGIIPGVEFNCPTRNCTYNPFYTLALDFQCKEMENFVQFNCHNTSSEWLSTVFYEGPGLASNVTSCGWYMNVPPNNGLQLMSGYEIQADGTPGEVLSTRFFTIIDAVTKEVFFGGSPNFPDVQNAVTDFIVASTPGGFDGALQNNTPVLTECEIHWVVKLVESSVTSGQLTEKALATLQFEKEPDHDNPYWPWSGFGSGTYAVNFSMTLEDNHSFTGDFSTFGFDNVSAVKALETWAEIAPSTITLPSQSNPVKSGPVFKLEWWLDPPRLATVPNPLIPSPWDAPNNVTAHMADAVTVMNQMVRRNALSQRQRHDVAVGQAFRYVVLIKINWVWISLPFSLLICSLIFLSATIVRSTKQQDKIGIFKTSTLAILFNGLGEDVQARFGSGHNRMGYAREIARDIMVQLDDD